MESCPASGELTKAHGPLFQSIPQAHVIHDLIITAKRPNEHDEAIGKVLDVISKSGMTLNIDKCILSTDKIPFWGIIVTKDGLKPDPKKVEALKYADRPKPKDELRSFMCMIQQGIQPKTSSQNSSFMCMIQSNREFIPKLAHKTVHLQSRLKKHKPFTWDDNCDREFEALKDSFTDAALLHHYNPDAKTYIWVDAHQTGLSAILMQGRSVDEAEPVAFASRATPRLM